MTILKGIIKDNKKALVDSAYLIGMQGINQLLPLFIMPYLLYILGGEGYGFVGFAFSLIQYGVLIVDFGFNFSATKKIAQCLDDKEAINRVFWSVVWAKSLLLVVTLLLLIVLMHIVPTFKLYYWAIIFTLPMVIGTTFTFVWLFQGVGKVREMAIINTVSKLLLLPLIFFVVKERGDYLWAAFLQSSVFLLTAIISNIYLYKWHIVKRPFYSWASVTAELKDSFPLFVSNASTSIYTQMFVVVLGFFTTVDVVGKYAAADRIMRSLCNGLFVPLYQAFFPKISQLAKQSVENAKKTLTQVRTLVVIGMMAICVAMFVGADWAENILGGDYIGISRLLRCLSFTPLFIGWGGVYGLMGLIAIGTGKSKRYFRNVYMIAAIVAVSLVFTFIPLYLELGAAVSLLVTEAFVGVAMYVSYKLCIDKNTYKLCQKKKCSLY